MPRFSEGQLLALTRDDEFQRRVATDPALNNAFRERDIDRSDEISETLVLLGGEYSGGGASFRAPTPAVLSMLWVARSPFVLGGKVDLADVDAALLILTLREKAFAKILDLDGEFIKEAAGLCDKTGVEAPAVCDAISTAMRHSVNAFQWFPEAQGVDAEESAPDYGAEWITRIVATVSQVSRYTPREIKWEVSMLECGYLVLQNARKNGVKGIARRTRAGMCMTRLDELMAERLTELSL